MNLTTTYMGLQLKNPIVPSASPLSQSLDGIRRMEDAGAGAVVMFSLFEEQIRRDAQEMETMLHAGADSFAEALSYFPDPDSYSVGPAQYLDLLSEASECVDIPIIGSLNGISREGWVEYARKMQDAGAKGIELNVYYIPTDIAVSGGEVENRYLDVLKAVKSAVTVPVAVKLSPFFSSPGHMAVRLAAAGADALVLFNRFYQPDFDLERMEVLPNLNLSTPYEIRLPLLWIAVLRGQIKASLGATRGVYGVEEAVKYILAGADVVMMASALLKKGIPLIGTVVRDLEAWMVRHDYSSIEQMKGAMSHRAVADPTAFERANYIKVIENFKREYTLGDEIE